MTQPEAEQRGGPCEFVIHDGDHHWFCGHKHGTHVHSSAGVAFCIICSDEERDGYLHDYDPGGREIIDGTQDHEAHA